MRFVVTGAAGFLGAATAAALARRDGDDEFVLVDRISPPCPDGRFVPLVVDLADAGTAQQVAALADVVIHLAALPGGAAEADPAQSYLVNYEATHRLMSAIADRGPQCRLVYASTIAVFGADLPARVDDETPPVPALTYGAHKLMIETELRDLVRRGALTGIALRFPGIVARPGDGAGLKSAFMNTIFHAMLAGRDATVPVSAASTLWLMSACQAAANLIHAATGGGDSPSSPVMTLPVVRTTMGELVETIRDQTASASTIDWQPDASLQALFGAYPVLVAHRATQAGFRSDGDVAQLVRNVLADLAVARIEAPRARTYP